MKEMIIKECDFEWVMWLFFFLLNGNKNQFHWETESRAK
jgi:hypothetical protein